jgi:hypothetical protein
MAESSFQSGENFMKPLYKILFFIFVFESPEIFGREACDFEVPDTSYVNKFSTSGGASSGETLTLRYLKQMFGADQKDRAILSAKHPAHIEQNQHSESNIYLGYDHSNSLDEKKSSDMERIWEDDNEREIEVLKMLQNGSVESGDELYYAAVIMQHSNCNKFIKLANDLAKASMEKGNENAKWLYAASLDRYLLGEGKKQKFGTQYNAIDGTILPLDPDTTDAERAKYNVSPKPQVKH